MSIFTAILLGLVQGITEFIPLSSSGHLALLQNVFKLNYVEEENFLFDAMLHMGTLVSIFLAYKKDIKSIIHESLLALGGRSEEEERGRLSPSARMAFFILLATVPLVFAIPFVGKIKSLFSGLAFVAFSFLVTGTLIFSAGKLEEGRKNEKTSTLKDVLLVGFAQMIALIPGISRSGATISVGLARGFKKEFAVKFSFLLAVPAVLGSALVSLVNAVRTGIAWSSLPAYIIGMLIAAVTGYYCIFILRRLLKDHNFGKLANYCWVLGVISLIASLFV